MGRALAPLAPVLATVGAVACSVDTAPADGALLRCGADDRCGEGERCQRGYCRPEPGAGALALGGVRVDPRSPLAGERLAACPLGLRGRLGDMTTTVTVEWLVDDAVAGSGPTFTAPASGRVAARARAMDGTGALIEVASCPVPIGAPRPAWFSDRPPRARPPEISTADEAPPRALVLPNDRRDRKSVV